jgi:hypothetical protein
MALKFRCKHCSQVNEIEGLSKKEKVKLTSGQLTFLMATIIGMLAIVVVFGCVAGLMHVNGIQPDEDMQVKKMMIEEPTISVDAVHQGTGEDGGWVQRFTRKSEVLKAEVGWPDVDPEKFKEWVKEAMNDIKGTGKTPEKNKEAPIKGGTSE